MDPTPVLAEYPEVCRPLRIEFLDSAGGFSGARLWRIEAPAGRLCLRRWPAEHPTEEGLEYVHRVLLRAAVAGLRWVPSPIPKKDGTTWCVEGGHLWELTRWMPGRADYHGRPTPARLRAAMSALAEFHLAVVQGPEETQEVGPSPGIAARCSLLSGWTHGGLEVLEESLDADVDGEILAQARRILPLARRAANRVAGILAAVQDRSFPLQPCICDIWHDHVLFDGEEVAGIVDFGAMRQEHVAADIARLLGSLVGDDAQGWQQGLESYSAVRPLMPAELELVEAFDRSTVLMSGLNWIDWLYRQRRVFPDLRAIATRLEGIFTRLRLLASGFRTHPVWLVQSSGGLGPPLQLP